MERKKAKHLIVIVQMYSQDKTEINKQDLIGMTSKDNRKNLFDHQPNDDFFRRRTT